MTSLPPIEYILMQPSYSVDIRNPEAYHGEFLKELAENISADSWALTVDDEIIFNEYVEKTVKEQIMEGVLRNRIADEPHQLFLDMFRNKKDGTVTVYMFGDCPWFLVIHYDAVNNSLIVSQYMSKAYENRFGKN